MTIPGLQLWAHIEHEPDFNTLAMLKKIVDFLLKVKLKDTHDDQGVLRTQASADTVQSSFVELYMTQRCFERRPVAPQPTLYMKHHTIRKLCTPY